MSLRFVRRGAFTLVELLVAMSIIVVLSSLVLLVVVNMGERDGTTDAAGLTRQWLMIAKNRAARDHGARGLRLVVGIDPNNPAKTSPYWVTECQYIEAPPILVTYPAPNGDFAPTGSPTDPRVEFTYTVSLGLPTNPQPIGTVLGKQCWILNLQASDAQQIQANSILQLPVIGSWHRIVSVLAINPMTGASTGLFAVRVRLDAVNPPASEMLNYPDAQMGAAGSVGAASYATQLFGITSPPRPLMAEPPLPLPKDICIDITPFTPLNGANPPFVDPPSFPSHQPTMLDYDILFAPNGNVLPVGAGAFGDGTILLWHRDYTKLRNAPSGNYALLITNNPFVAPFPPRQYDPYPFQNGGEQQIVAVRCKTGALGQFPVLWPSAGGVYAGTDTPHALARFGATSP